MKTYLNGLLSLCLTIGLQACNDAGQGGHDKTADSSIDSLTNTDQGKAFDATTDNKGRSKAFTSSAATGGMMEVEAATLALKKSKNKLVKDFAARMLKDHTLANKELNAIAEARGFSLAGVLPSEMANHITGLNELEDRAFDLQYIRMMINDHKKTVQLFADGASLPDSALKAFAVKNLPVIRQHHQTAVEIGNRLNITNANNGDDVLGISPAKLEKR